MADTARPGKRLTLREFIEWEERQPRKYEFIGGLVRMMAGGTLGHSQIKGNIFAALHGKLRGARCRPFDSDAKVITSDSQAYYPDVTVDCGALEPAATIASSPTIVFEVLSKSTRESDLAEKLPSYQATPSIKQIVCVEPDRMHLMVWRRGLDGWIEEEVVRPEDSLALDVIGVELSMADIYQDVAFG